MLSVLINTNLLGASVENRFPNIYFINACVYNADKQKETFIPGLKKMIIPTVLKMVWWEKLFERMCRHFSEDLELKQEIGIIMFMDL